MKQTMLSTIDNPFNPFDDYTSWNNWDQQQGYNTSSYLARIALTSSGLSDLENHHAIETAIDEIVELNPLGLYKKVTKDS